MVDIVTLQAGVYLNTIIDEDYSKNSLRFLKEQNKAAVVIGKNDD